MGFLKNMIHAVFYGALFYLFLGLLIGVHGLVVPAIAFSWPAVLSAVLFMYVLIANYRIGQGANAKS